MSFSRIKDLFYDRSWRTRVYQILSQEIIQQKLSIRSSRKNPLCTPNWQNPHYFFRRQNMTPTTVLDKWEVESQSQLELKSFLQTERAGSRRFTGRPQAIPEFKVIFRKQKVDVEYNGLWVSRQGIHLVARSKTQNYQVESTLSQFPEPAGDFRGRSRNNKDGGNPEP